MAGLGSQKVPYSTLFKIEAQVADASQTIRPKFDTKFNPEKTYLTIGCLGGLGRSLSKWMFKRGAREFVFIGRSGTDRSPAKLLVNDLEAFGAQVVVVHGDVGVYADVGKAVNMIEGPIGGVVQAAMGLDVRIYFILSSNVERF